MTAASPGQLAATEVDVGDRDRRLASVLRKAERNAGFFSVGDAAEHDIARTCLDRLVREGLLERVAANHLRAAHLPWTLDARHRQALLRTRPESALGARSALHEWGLAARPDRIEILTPRGQKGSSQGRRLIQATDIAAADIATRHGVRCSTPIRATIDAARWLSSEELNDVVSRGISDGALDLDRLRTRFLELARMGRPGVRSLRASLSTFDDRPLATTFERDFELIIQRAGLVEPVRQHRVVCDGRTYFLDHAWPEHATWSECDSMLAHGSAEALRRDLERQNRIVGTTGFEPLRFTYFDVHERPDYVVEILARHIPRQRGR